MIAIHPALRPHEICYAGARLDFSVSLRFRVHRVANPDLQNLQADFVTRPFCQELLIRHTVNWDTFPSDYISSRHVLHVKGGIRIGHLIKKVRDLSHELRRSHPAKIVAKEEFVVHFMEDMLEEDMAEFKRVNKLPLQCGYGLSFKLQNQWPVIKGGRKTE